ncbi:MAG: 30S ribosome-binding factor RbfA [Acidobacteria bacterium]|nr:30S ribosome-binding factor RbfA [Acidobacteriota bacterium]
MDERRTKRVAEALREELIELIGFELSDPRLDGVQVVEVHLSPDMRVASVALDIPGDADAQVRALEAIQNAKSFIKRELASRMELFRMPELRFESNLSPGLNSRMDYLMRKIRKGRPRDGVSGENMEKKPEA